MSKGEEKIAQILAREGVEFEREKTFQDLKHGLFRFDFYMGDVCGRRAVIEFNGAQHYEFVAKFYKNRQQFMKAQEHDRRKISYCLSNDIDIYIIPYWDLDRITSLQSMQSPQYKAKTRWHNDEVNNNRKDRH